jgi:hypothetical protein
LKPYIFGSVSNILPKVVNKFDLIYQVSVNQPSSLTVYDGGLALSSSGNFTTLAGLMAATIPAGTYATCLALGLFRLGALPAFEITADVVEGATLAVRSAARVAQRILALLSVSNIDTASFDALHTFNSAEVGIFIDTDLSALELVGQVLGSIGGAIFPTATGTFRVAAISAPSGTPARTFTMREQIGDGSFVLAKGPTNEGDGVPAWSVVINWGRVWQTQASGQLAGSVDLSRQTYLQTSQRQSAAQDASVKTAHPLASELVIDTLLTTQSAAEAEAARRLAMYKVRRDYLILTVEDEFAEDIELGDVVEVDFPRFGFDGGKLFKVVGRADDFTQRHTELTLWG